MIKTSKYNIGQLVIGSVKGEYCDKLTRRFWVAGIEETEEGLIYRLKTFDSKVYFRFEDDIDNLDGTEDQPMLAVKNKYDNGV